MASTGNDVNRMPQSGNPTNSATVERAYEKQEMRLQFSVRTKLASGLLTPADSKYRDSLWLGYTQQSSWQLFNSGISRTNGDDVASQAVKSKIKELVDGEEPKRPHSDQKIVELLKKAGIDIARRTVAKYREQMGILSSSKRKQVF